MFAVVGALGCAGLGGGDKPEPGEAAEGEGAEAREGERSEAPTAATADGEQGEAGGEEGQEGEKGEEGEEGEEGGIPDRVVLGGEALEALDLQIVEATQRELNPSLELPAEIAADPNRRAEIGPLVAGRVVDVAVDIGDRVEKGAPLVVLESPEVGRARAEWIGALARLDVAKANQARESALAADQATSARELQEAEAVLKTSAADESAARAQLAAIGVRPGPESNDASARLVLRAPFGGTVVTRNAHPGRPVESGETLLEIVDLDALQVVAQVHEREMRFVQTGQPVQVEVRALPGQVFNATVTRLGGVLDERTRSATVRADLPNPDHLLRPGMFATARVSGTDAKNARTLLVIPWSAVQQVDGHAAVFVKVGEREFSLRRVHTGERAGDDVEVLNGLKPGDAVVANGSFLLKGELMKSTLGEDED
ncbi:MAG: efflux RND transporter periplasmic adaptor subunit [Myxococcota bacterium]